MRRRITIKVPESLHNKLDEFRRKYKEVNGEEISLIKATEIFGNSVKMPKIPNIFATTLFKNEKPNKKSRPY